MHILDYIHASDLDFFRRFHSSPSRATIQKYARWISSTADGHFYVLIGLCLLIFNDFDSAQILAVAFVIERSLYVTAKNVFKRRRPPQAIQNFQSIITPSDHFSLPSGHTSAAFLMTIFLGYIFPASLIISVPWALSVGASRVILGVHFPSDILAGAILGSSVCALSIILLT